MSRPATTDVRQRPGLYRPAFGGTPEETESEGTARVVTRVDGITQSRSWGDRGCPDLMVRSRNAPATGNIYPTVEDPGRDGGH